MNARVAWREVGIFLGLTFALTYLLDLFIWRTVGYRPVPALGILLQLQMLIPAFCAILLQSFCFKSSPIYFRQKLGRPRIIFYFFLFYAMFYAVVGVLAPFTSEQATIRLLSLATQVMTIGGLLLTVAVSIASRGAPLARAGLSWGRFRYYLLFGLLMVGIYGGMTGLNVLFGLGQAVDVKVFISAASGGRPTGMEGLSPAVILAFTGVQSVLLAPLIALLIAFGEEYGWRGYLQKELIKLGVVRGFLLLGVIWGIWHAPVIMMGHNYPGYPVLGVFLMTAYTIALAFIFGLAVLRSGSVWLAAFLHALNNQAYSFFTTLVYKPNDPVFSFGIGIYGLLVFAIIVALLLWRWPWWQALSPAASAQGAPNGPAGR